MKRQQLTDRVFCISHHGQVRLWINLLPFTGEQILASIMELGVNLEIYSGYPFNCPQVHRLDLPQESILFLYVVRSAQFMHQKSIREFKRPN